MDFYKILGQLTKNTWQNAWCTIYIKAWLYSQAFLKVGEKGENHGETSFKDCNSWFGSRIGSNLINCTNTVKIDEVENIPSDTGGKVVENSQENCDEAKLQLVFDLMALESVLDLLVFMLEYL